MSIKSSHNRGRLPQKVTTSRTVGGDYAVADEHLNLGRRQGGEPRGEDENSREENPWRALREYAHSRAATALSSPKRKCR